VAQNLTWKTVSQTRKKSDALNSFLASPVQKKIIDRGLPVGPNEDLSGQWPFLLYEKP
jgi:hypothetical protein